MALFLKSYSFILFSSKVILLFIKSYVLLDKVEAGRSPPTSFCILLLNNQSETQTDASQQF